MKHKLKPRQWLPWVIIMVLVFIYEIFCVFFGAANDTLSHVMVWAMQESPWLQWGVPAICMAVLGHWLFKWWPWRMPKFVDEQKANDGHRVEEEESQ